MQRSTLHHERCVGVDVGAGKGSEIAVTSTLFVETVEKKPGAVATKRFHGDASRVIASGNGLKKGFSGRAANFTLDIKDAGWTFNSSQSCPCNNLDLLPTRRCARAVLAMTLCPSVRLSLCHTQVKRNC